MARFQSLPDRIDCITTTIPDSVMCQAYGMNIACNLTINCSVTGQFKNRLEITVGCCLWTVPAGIQNMFIEVWGSGGGGGGSGNCCCCSQGPGGGAGGYAAVQVSTVAGCQYTVCAGSGGAMGCAACTNGGNGNTSYISGYNLTGFCVQGGCGGCSGPCNAWYPGCYGVTTANCGCAYLGSSNYVGNAVYACGEGGHLFGEPYGCRYENKGGSAPFNGGIGSWNTYQNCCEIGCCQSPGGDFPGGGGSGAASSCCCGQCNCGGCGAAGFVRIWY